MISETQQKALSVLAELLALAPDIRLGQLFAHLDFMGECHLGKGLGNVDDDDLLAVMVRHRSELQARLQLAQAEPSASLASSDSTPAAQ
ncbi:MAG: hypothetical protein L0Y72_07225 [Gemmataceae bacterium]|nr:hypothetical protein [Gemmataceae bacterium]MCI0738818.1 hypothetical protein [Gemmataceae bacterium]